MPMFVCIHVKNYKVYESHMRTPSSIYYDKTMGYFIHRYQSVGFVVICEYPVGCSVQPQFNRSNVHVSRESQHFAVDMAILSACGHIILSVGTFGWWAAYLGPDSRQVDIIMN